MMFELHNVSLNSSTFCTSRFEASGMSAASPLKHLIKRHRSAGGGRWVWVAWLLLLALAARVAPRAQALSKMEVAFAWNQLPFAFDSEEQRRGLLRDGTYVPGEAVAFDVDMDVDSSRVFITTPHLFAGSPVTLSFIQNISEHHNPTLVPYPDWSWHAGNRGCDGLASVFRVDIDDCGRLWVVDSGDELVRGNLTFKCPPQLLVFDLSTDRLIARHRFPRNADSCTNSLMLTVVTEQMGDSCSDDVYAYIADAGMSSIFVFHLQSGKSWRAYSDYFYPDVNARDFVVAGRRFSKMVGVLGLALSPCLDAECDRYLYFHSFSGYLEGRVLTSVLRNSTLFEGGVEGARPYIGVIGNRQWQAVAQAMTEDGILIFGQLGENSLNCWNTDTPYSPNYIQMVEYDYDFIRIQMGVKVIKNSFGEEIVWSLSNNIQNVFAFDFTPNNSYPIYVVTGSVNDLIEGTLCESWDN